MPEGPGTTPTDKEVCPICGKHRSTTVSGSDKAWVFKPNKCECAVAELPTSGSAAEPAAPPCERSFETEKTVEPAVETTTDRTSEPAVETTVEPASIGLIEAQSKVESVKDVVESVEAVKSEAGSDDANVESQPAGATDSVVCSVESVKGQAPSSEIEDSGGWATDSIRTQASKPPVSTEGVESGSWVSLDGIGRDSVSNAPRPFKTLPVIGPSGRSPSATAKKKSGKKEDSLTLSAVRDSSGSIGSGSGNNASTVSGSNISSNSSGNSNISSSSSSGTGINSFNSITGISSADIATASGASKQKNKSSQPEHWVPVSKKSLDTSQSQFKDDSALFGLIHQSENAEEKEKPSTRNAIQQAFRRNRIKTLIVAIVAIALGFWLYSYVSKTEAYKQAQAKALKEIQGVTSKKNASRFQKKPKRNR